MTYRVRRSCGHGWEGKADHLPVPALNILTPLVPLAAVLCFPGGFHDTFPTNRFPTAHLQQTCNHTDCQSANIVQPYSSCRLFRHAVPSPSFPTWELRYLNTIVRVCVGARVCVRGRVYTLDTLAHGRESARVFVWIRLWIHSKLHKALWWDLLLAFSRPFLLVNLQSGTWKWIIRGFKRVTGD